MEDRLWGPRASLTLGSTSLKMNSPSSRPSPRAAGGCCSVGRLGPAQAKGGTRAPQTHSPPTATAKLLPRGARNGRDPQPREKENTRHKTKKSPSCRKRSGRNEPAVFTGAVISGAIMGNLITSPGFRWTRGPIGFYQIREPICSISTGCCCHHPKPPGPSA